MVRRCINVGQHVGGSQVPDRPGDTGRLRLAESGRTAVAVELVPLKPTKEQPHSHWPGLGFTLSARHALKKLADHWTLHFHPTRIAADQPAGHGFTWEVVFGP
jgi:hypothetical protein